MLLTRIALSSKDNFVGEIAREHEANIRVVRCSPHDKAGGSGLLRVETEKGVTVDDIREWFSGNGGQAMTSCSIISPGRFLVSVDNPNCTLCRTMAGTECYLESGASSINGSVTWRVYVPDKEALRGLIDRLRGAGFNVELKSVKRAENEFELTAVQDKMIRKAFEKGYYDIPKKIMLDQLAAESGMSKATLNLILRRGQHKLLSEHLGN